MKSKVALIAMVMLLATAIAIGAIVWPRATVTSASVESGSTGVLLTRTFTGTVALNSSITFTSVGNLIGGRRGHSATRLEDGRVLIRGRDGR